MKPPIWKLFSNPKVFVFFWRHNLRKTLKENIGKNNMRWNMMLAGALKTSWMTLMPDLRAKIGSLWTVWFVMIGGWISSKKGRNARVLDSAIFKHRLRLPIRSPTSLKACTSSLSLPPLSSAFWVLQILPTNLRHHSAQEIFTPTTIALPRIPNTSKVLESTEPNKLACEKLDYGLNFPPRTSREMKHIGNKLVHK